MKLILKWCLKGKQKTLYIELFDLAAEGKETASE